MGYAKENVFLNKKSSPFEMSKLKNKELFLIRVPVDVINIFNIYTYSFDIYYIPFLIIY